MLTEDMLARLVQQDDIIRDLICSKAQLEYELQTATTTAPTQVAILKSEQQRLVCEKNHWERKVRSTYQHDHHEDVAHDLEIYRNILL